MAASSGERTEKPTPQRLREMRKRGDIPTSPELISSGLALVALVALGVQAPHIWGTLQGLLTQAIAQAAHPRTLGGTALVGRLRDDVLQGMQVLIPLAAAGLAATLALGIASTRGAFSLHKFTQGGHKLNPLANARNLFSKESLFLLGKAAIKLAIAAAIIMGDVPQWAQAIPRLPLINSPTVAGALWSGAFDLAMRITAAFLVIGLADFGYRYLSWYRRARMTREEIKEEFKRNEGNPQMRARMRSVARKRLRDLVESGSVRRVPEATVVVTNPTHYAVAIHYVEGQMRAPKVIAKGQNIVALRIKDTARRHNIPIVENKPLAQALYKTVKVKQEIPPELYRAVAEVVGFVFRLRAGAQRASRIRGRAA